MSEMVEAMVRPTYALARRVFAPALGVGNTTAHATTLYSQVRSLHVRVSHRKDGALVNLTAVEV
jgi:hypothetical protein